MDYLDTQQDLVPMDTSDASIPDQGFTPNVPPPPHRRRRTWFTTEAVQTFEAVFELNRHPDHAYRKSLVKATGYQEARIEVSHSFKSIAIV